MDRRQKLQAATTEVKTDEGKSATEEAVLVHDAGW